MPQIKKVLIQLIKYLRDALELKQQYLKIEKYKMIEN